MKKTEQTKRDKDKAKDGLVKRGNNWHVNIQINGQRFRKAAGPDKRTAALILAELQAQAALGRVARDWSGLDQFTTEKKVKLFSDAAASYLAERVNLKPSTIRGYGEILKNYLIPEFGDLLVDQISEEKIAKFQASLVAKLSPVRINNIMGLLRYILKVCLRRKLIAENPAAGVDSLREQPPDVDPMTLPELERALECLDQYYRPLFTTLAFTGARPNEMLALRWADVDFKRKEMRIRKGRVRGEEGAPKTNSSVRTIPMLPVVEDVLLGLKGRSTQHVGGYVFLTKKGVPFSKHVDREWRDALRRAGLKHRPSYQLRHTFASYCLQQGCDPGWLATVLGHASLQTTFKHYARYIQDATKENERRLGASMEKSPLMSAVKDKRHV